MKPLLDTNWRGHTQQVIPWPEAMAASGWRRSGAQGDILTGRITASGNLMWRAVPARGVENAPSPGVTRVTVFLTMQVSGG